MNFMRITPWRIIVALVVVCVLVSIGVTIAASRGSSSKPKRTPKNTALPTKIVPDVVGQPYVFAEGTLQAHGFGWQVEGKVAGWAEALVVSESPVANTVVVDTGAPRVTLQLAKPAGAQSGTPENSSPYSATKILFPVPAPGATTTTGTTTTGTTTTGTTATTTPATTTTTTRATTTTTTTTTTTPRATTTTKPTKPVSKPKPSKPAPSGSSSRLPAFVIAGATPEPLDELPLPVRAKKLNAWLDSHRKVSAANARYWLIQQAWIVTGAKFGWWHGAQALETLVAVDQRIEKLWRVGSKSEAEARAALAFVHAHGG